MIGALLFTFLSQHPSSTQKGEGTGTPQNSFPPPDWAQLINDPMKQTSVQTEWLEDAGCRYEEEIYLMESVGPNYCVAEAEQLTELGDIAYEIQMRIVQGEEGGIIFHLNSDRWFYYFSLRIDGTYRVMRVQSQEGGSLLFDPQSSDAIKQGHDQENTLQVEVKGNWLYFFVNGQFLTKFFDKDMLHPGHIGVATADYLEENNTLTELHFHNAKVWINADL